LFELQSGMKIAIGGKGGVGKTTVCAVLARLFVEDGFDVLAIDADSNANLASAFGMGCEQSPEPLVGMKELIAERTGTGREATGAYFRLNPKVSDLPEKYWVKVEGVKLLVLGGITRAGGGCACPEGAFLKALLSHTVLERQEIVLVDLSAGVEFMGRACVQGIDALLLVVEPGGRSIDTARRIAKMAGDTGIGHVAAIANKVTDASQIDAIKRQLAGMTVMASLNYDPSVSEADFEGRAVYRADSRIVEELKAVKKDLTELVGCDVAGES